MTQIYRSTPILFGAFLAAIIPTYLIRFDIFGIPTTFWEVALYALTVVAIVTKSFAWHELRHDPLRWPIVLLVLASLVGVVTSDDLRVALGQWKALIFDPLVFYGLLRATVPAGGIPILINSFLMGGLALAVQGVWAVVVDSQAFIADDHRLIGLFNADAGASPNYLALYLAPVTVLGLLGAFQAAGWQRWFRIAVALCGALALYFTASRAGILAAGFGLSLGLVVIASWRWPKQRMRIWFGFALAILGVAIIAGPSFLPDITRKETSGRLATSNNIRYEIWQTTVKDLVPMAPVAGLGWGMYQPVFTTVTADRVNYPEYIAPYALHPHNSLLATWANMGVAGLVAWLAVIAVLLRQLSFLKRSWVIFLGVYGAIAVHSLVDTAYYKNDLAAMFWLITALVIICATVAQTERRHK